ncbi:UNVERIFIED_CONTAM: hypothetical protein GTU68_063281 [Idotea baltica]|nr:hypothetical protein [Idotea baltica]
MVLEVCQQLSSLCAKEGKTPLVISVAASPTLAETRTALGTGVRVARVIPSITVSVCSGIAAVFSDVEADAQQATDLFEQIGAVLKVKSESEFDAVLGMCASGLGFLALVAEALAEGGVKMGLTSADALKCASYTMLGAGKLLEESGMHPAELRNRVASPGGTTIAGLHELEKAGVRGAFISAIEAAVVRARK